MDDDDRPMRSAGERLARIEEKLNTFLDSDDAIKLMDHAAQGDSKLQTEFGTRLTDFRSEVREAFRHSEKETGALIYRATTESEGRLTTAINAINAQLAAMATTPSERPGRWHPAPLLGVGTGMGGLLVYLILALFGFAPRPGG